MSVLSQDSESNHNSQPKTFLQWQMLRRSNPSGMAGYYSTKSQQQMMADRKALGDRWYE